MNGFKKCLLVGMTATLSITLYAFSDSSTGAKALENADANSYNNSLYKLEMSLNNLANAGNRLYLSQNGESLNYYYDGMSRTNLSSYSNNGSTSQNDANTPMTLPANTTSTSARYNGSTNGSMSGSTGSTRNTMNSTSTNNSYTSNQTSTMNSSVSGTTSSQTLGSSSSIINRSSSNGLIGEIQGLKSNAESLRAMLFNGNTTGTSTTANVGALDDCCKVLNITTSAINRYVNDYQTASMTNVDLATSRYNFTDRLIRSNIQISNQAINSLKNGLNGSMVNSNLTSNVNTAGNTNVSSDTSNSGTSTQIQPRITTSSTQRTNSRLFSNNSRPGSNNPNVSSNYLEKNNVM